MVKELISIIVPVYNVEKYISECLNSILKQDYFNYEVLLIDDGSTDESYKVCSSYAEKDSRIKLYKKTNGGLSDARNYGINKANGEYLTFVDSDDTIAPNYLSVLFNACIKFNAEVSQVNLVTKKNKLSLEKSSSLNTMILSGTDAFKNLMLFDYIKVYAWGKLYRSNLFKNISFPVGKLMEDSFTTFKLLLKSSKVAYVNSNLYYYRQRPSSIMNTTFNDKKLDLLGVPAVVKKYVRENKISIEDDYILYYTMRINCDIYNQIVKSSKNKKREYYLKERKQIIEFLSNNKFSFLNIKYKLMLFGITKATYLYNILLRGK